MANVFETDMTQGLRALSAVVSCEHRNSTQWRTCGGGGGAFVRVVCGGEEVDGR